MLDLIISFICLIGGICLIYIIFFSEDEYSFSQKAEALCGSVILIILGLGIIFKIIEI